MKKRIAIFTVMIMCLSLCACNLKYATKEACLFKIWLEPIGKHKVFSLEDGCDITVHYTWCGRVNTVTGDTIEGTISIVSDEVEVEKNEIKDEEFWSDDYEPFSEHEMTFFLETDMLKEDSGEIRFSISAVHGDSSTEGTGVSLYYARKGNRLCLSEYEGAAETYFAMMPVVCWVSAVLIVILSYALIKYCYGKHKTHMERKNIAALMAERASEKPSEK